MNLYFSNQNGKLVISFLYVDDLVLSRHKNEEIQRIKANLCMEFEMFDLSTT